LLARRGGWEYGLMGDDGKMALKKNVARTSARGRENTCRNEEKKTPAIRYGELVREGDGGKQIGRCGQRFKQFESHGKKGTKG